MLLVELAVILALVLVNGLLAGAEIAIVGVDKARLRQLTERGGRRARAVLALRKNPERFFATVQVGITVIGATAAAIGGATFAEDLEPVLRGIQPLSRHAEWLSVAIVVVIVSLLSVVIGELVPKSLALRHAERFALAIAPLILGLSSVARPVVWLLTACSNAVLKLFGDRTNFTESRLSPNELAELVEEASEAGSIHPAAGEIAARALQFSNLTAEQAMVPRSHVVGIPMKASIEEVKRILLEHGYSRLPVHGDELDDILGYVLAKDLLALAWQAQLIVLEDVLRPAYFVPAKMPAPALLQELRERKTHLAIVVDERGTTTGIVTLEDLLEELVGEIASELTEDAAPLSVLPDGSMVAAGDVAIRDANRELGTELPEGDGWSTLGGLCMALAGRVPRQGESMQAKDGTQLEVEAATDRAVLRVRLRPMRAQPLVPST